MIKLISRFLCICALLCLMPQARAQVNGWHNNPRVFNDFSTSTLTINNSNTNPGTVSIDDRNLTDDGTGGNFANRHDVLASGDSGASNLSRQIYQGFTISTTLTLTDGSNSPRKEAGIRLNSPVTGDALLIVNSDAGEIVAFGGGAPFHLFASGAAGYVPGTPITLGMRYDPPGTAGTNALITYSVNYPTRGINTSFSDFFSNIEGGAVNYNFGVYTQVSPANANDFVTASFTGLTATLVPEPVSLGVAGLGAVLLLARRRSVR